MVDSNYRISRVSGAPVSDAELLADLKRVAYKLGVSKLSSTQYRQVGFYADTTISRRFGSWNKALKTAGLSIVNESVISDERLFENILSLWQGYGRQPRRADLMSDLSKFSQTPYNRRFGSWGAGLAAFSEYMATSRDDEGFHLQQEVRPNRKRTSRDPTLRLRYRVLVRDHFKCCLCGANPAVIAGVTLQVDHVVPWSKGGETVLDNLQTTCNVCNLGKSDLV